MLSLVFIQRCEHFIMDTPQDVDALDTLVEEFEGTERAMNRSFLNSLYCRVGQCYDIIGHHDIKYHDNRNQIKICCKCCDNHCSETFISVWYLASYKFIFIHF